MQPFDAALFIGIKVAMLVAASRKLKDSWCPLFTPFILMPSSGLLSVIWMWPTPRDGGAEGQKEPKSQTGFLCIFLGERNKHFCCLSHHYFGFLFSWLNHLLSEVAYFLAPSTAHPIPDCPQGGGLTEGHWAAVH